MRIRTQNCWAIVPLFLGLGLLIGALMFTVQYRELRWGLNEEATSIAVAAARHLDTDAPRQAIEPDHWIRAMQQATAVMEWGRANRLALISSAGQETWFDSAPDSDATRPISLPAPLAQRADERGYAASRIQQDGSGRYIHAYSPVRDADGTVAYLVVEISANAVAGFFQRIKQEIGILVIVTVAIGLLLALLLSRMISRRIIRLSHAAQRVEDGHYDERYVTTGIQEISDLGNTFNTMSSVLSEVLNKSRRAVIEAEQFRTEDDLARAFSETFMADTGQTVSGTLELVAGQVSTHSETHFHGIWQEEGHVLAVVGELETADGLEAPLQASAAAHALRDYWLACEPEEALRRWAVPLPLRQAHVIYGHVNELHTAEWNANERTFAHTSLTIPGRPLLFHTLPDAQSKRLTVYVDVHRGIATRDLLHECRKALDEDVIGAFLIIKCISRAGEAPSN